MNQIAFLGHIIFSDGLKVDLQKVEVIKSWERSKNVSEVWSFLDLMSYYMHFFEGFSKLSLSWTTLTKKVMRFEWMHECQKSFQELKRRFTTTPILIFPTCLLFPFVMLYVIFVRKCVMGGSNSATNMASRLGLCDKRCMSYLCVAKCIMI